MKKLVTILLFIALPAAVMAQPAPQTIQTFDLVTPPGSAVSGVAHVEDIKIGDRRQIHTVVTTNEGIAELTFDGRTIELGDGYTIMRETLVNTSAVRVVRLTASVPDGTSESAVIVWNRQSREATGLGAERYAKLLKGSHDAVIAAQILPELTFNSVQKTGFVGKGLSSITIHGDDCVKAALAVEAACVAVILGCGSENPAICGMTLYGLGSQLDTMATACPQPVYEDTIGWG